MSPEGRLSGGKLSVNVMHFGRLLRAAGLPVGSGHVMDAVRTLEAVGLDRRDDVYWALHAAFVKRRDQQELFRQAFELFWKDPFGKNQALALLLPKTKVPEEDVAQQTSRRLQEAFDRLRPPPEPPPESEREKLELDMALTYSDTEQLRRKDFEQMSAEELRRARALITRMRLPRLAVPTRRFRPTPHADRVDLRRMLRASLRSGGHDLPLRFKRRGVRPPPIVVLCDISGSMDRYSRMFLFFLHTLTNDRDRVYSFVFGTRLTNITRWLRYRDVDRALAKVGEAVGDWSGGTRIGACLEDFNKRWSRRVLFGGPIVLLVTDGLDRAPGPPGPPLAPNAERLHKSCRRLIWLNPLLRFEDFEPRAAGVRALLPHVDDFRSVHDLSSLEALVDLLDA